MPNDPLQLAVAPESIWSVRPPERKTLSAAVSIESVAPEAITVVPASVWLPPLQLKLPETVSVPAPPIVPPDWVRLAVVDALVASVSESDPPVSSSVPWLWRLRIDVSPVE